MILTGAEAPTTITLGNYRNYVGELKGILRKFEGNDDRLSRGLSLGGREILRLVNDYELAGSQDSRDRIVSLATEKIDTLVQDILLNLSNERSHPHLFAREMINFFKAINPSKYCTNGDLYAMSREIFENEIRIGRNQMAQAKMALMVANCKRQVAESRRQDQQVIDEVTAQAALHEAALNQRIDAIQKSYSDTIANINRQIAFVEEAHRAKVAAIEAEIAALGTANSEIATALRNQLAQLQNTHQSTVADLNGQLASVHQKCQTLDAKLDSTTRELKSEISAANSRTYEASAQASQLKTSLGAADQKYEELEEKYQGLGRQYNDSQARVNDLQYRVNNLKSQPCVIS